MASIFVEPALGWLILGVVLIAIEVLTVPGIGLFLAGLGAIATALLIQLRLLDESAVVLQFTLFFVLTAVITLVLWKPLQRRRRSRNRGDIGYHNLVGTTGTVASRGLSRGAIGQVTWSGTRMNAVIDAACEFDTLPEGTVIAILSVEGNTLSVIPADSGAHLLPKEFEL